MGYLAVTEARLLELREKHRPAVLVVVEERSKGGRIWKDSKGLASKLYSFKHDPGSLVEEKKVNEGDNSSLESHSSNLDDLLNGLSVDSEVDSLPDVQEHVIFLFLPFFSHCSAAFLKFMKVIHLMLDLYLKIHKYHPLVLLYFDEFLFL